mmetsp:Transcript_5263/g.4449  ORF Transcript_5263/g.4449 Transcript_5263/m.4449 type:complete len:225 (-) Transcript_5263:84-758(-)
MTQYGRPDYWDERYTRDSEPFDWYQRFSGVKDVITQYINPESRILNVGCGNSRMSEEMFDEGYTNIMNVDISSVVIKAMQEKYKDKGPNFQYRQMDITQMGDFEKSSFDCVVDKGTLDSVLCGEGSVTRAHKALSEINRVLTSKGVYICISYGIPQHRSQYFQKSEFGWELLQPITVYKPTISTSISLSNEDKDSPNYHYIYICKKTGSGGYGGDNNEDQKQDI